MMIDIQTILHYSLHLIAPAGIAYVFFRTRWKTAYGIMLATMLVDLDHLLATPIFDPTRCSIGFHPLHSYPAIAVYFMMMFVPNFYVRVVGIGLFFHMVTDYIDCLFLL